MCFHSSGYFLSFMRMACIAAPTSNDPEAMTTMRVPSIDISHAKRSSSVHQSQRNASGSRLGLNTFRMQVPARLRCFHTHRNSPSTCVAVSRF